MQDTAGIKKDELISTILWWTIIYGHTSVGRPHKTYIDQLSADTGCLQEDLTFYG